MSSYFGGDDEEYEVWNHSGQEEGDVSSWLDLISFAEAGINTPAKYNAVADIVDLENLVDYMLLNFYGGNNDWDQNNWYASKRDHPTGKWRFFSWDGEQFFKELDRDVTPTNNAEKPSRLFRNCLLYTSPSPRDRG